jgi:hypothetical protein
MSSTRATDFSRPTSKGATGPGKQHRIADGQERQLIGELDVLLVHRLGGRRMFVFRHAHLKR